MYWLTKITSTLHFRIKIFIRTATFQRVLRSCFDVVLVSNFSVLAPSVGVISLFGWKEENIKEKYSIYNYDKDHRFWNTRLNKCSCWDTKKYKNKSILDKNKTKDNYDTDPYSTRLIKYSGFGWVTNNTFSLAYI